MSKPLRTIIKGTALGLSLGLVISAAIAGVKLGLHGRLPAGTVIAGVDMSYKTPVEAVKILKEKETEYLSKPLKFTLREGRPTEETITISPQEIGLEYFITETVSTIDRIDLKENSLPQVLNGKREEGSTEILYTFDSGKLTKIIDEKLRLGEIAPKDAEFFINEKRELDIAAEKPGMIIDYDKTTKETKNALAYMKNIQIELEPISAVPSITKTDLEALKDEITLKLETAISLTYEDEKWEFSPIGHLDCVGFKEISVVPLPYLNIEVELEDKYLPESFSGKKTVAITLDETKFNLFIDETVAPDIEDPVDPISIYRDESGKIIINGKGDNGMVIQKGMLKKSLELAINNTLPSAPIHTKIIKAPVTISKELQEIGIKELLSVGHTSFSGSPNNRIHNITTGVNHFSGMLIAPGEEFSFNTNLGRVDNTTGYKKELVITKVGTIPEYGGGLCQVSTTTYRAAVFAGLPITDRAPHSYAVSYYSQILGYGLDATIYLGGQDLKFVNDTPGHILIHSYVEGSHAYFKFYGTSDGRKVAFDGPHLSNYINPPDEVIYVTSNDLAPGETKQVERKHTGFDALWYRTITYIDGTSKTEEIFSRYKATQEKWWVGPDAAEAGETSPADEPAPVLTPELMIEPKI